MDYSKDNDISVNAIDRVAFTDVLIFGCHKQGVSLKHTTDKMTFTIN